MGTARSHQLFLKQGADIVLKDSTTIYLSYTFFKKPLYVLAATLFGLTIYYVLGYAFRPNDFIFEGVSLLGLVGFFVVDQVIIESVTTFILFQLIVRYAALLKLDRIEMNVRSLLHYQLAFTPVVLLAFFVFNPVVQTLRFLLRHYGEYSWDLYRMYFFSWPLYFTYLGIIIPIVYLSLNLNLVGEYRKHLNALKTVEQPGTKKRYLQRIVGNYGGAECPILVQDVLWFEVEGRDYFAITKTGKYRISKTLKKLEHELDPTQFFRLTRSVITNINGIESFSPWIDGKYIVRMRDSHRTEFTLSRIRVKQFKNYVSTS